MSGRQPREAFYGGAAGGGKSEALLMAAAMYVDVPGYSALILRRNLPDLKQPGALIPRSKEWWTGKARWHVNDKTWTFPSGSVIRFGFLEHDDDMGNYMGSEYQFIGFDEATQFPYDHYSRLMTRNRKRRDLDVPLRIRAASNPGGIGHEWVRQHFMVEGPDNGRVFIPAKLDDNPSLDGAEYRETFAALDPITRAQWLEGDWSVSAAGAQFRREWFEIVDDYPPEAERVVRFWDTAATAPMPGKEHSADWTVGTKMMRYREQFWILDVIRFQGTPGTVQQVVRQTALLDGYDTEIYMEQEPGASGVHMIEDYQFRVVPDFYFQGVRSGNNKARRAGMFSSAAQAGKVKLVRGPWIMQWLAELGGFPEGQNDDDVDSGAGAYNALSQGGELREAHPNVRRMFSWQ